MREITDEGALDDECHLWENWIKFVKQDSDPEHIRCPRCSRDHSAKDCMWVDTAYGFMLQRTSCATNVLSVLKDIV